MSYLPKKPFFFAGLLGAFFLAGGRPSLGDAFFLLSLLLLAGILVFRVFFVLVLFLKVSTFLSTNNILNLANAASASYVSEFHNGDYSVEIIEELLESRNISINSL